jgi:hypothetical protein
MVIPDHRRIRAAESAGMLLASEPGVARGWESKNIEAQQEEAAKPRRSGPAPTAEQRERGERRQALILTRARTAHELARATAPAHRRMLEQALAALDADLAKLD